MTIDLTGGLSPSRDLMLAESPTAANVRESISMWISDDAGRFGLPQCRVESFSGHWEDRGIQANIAFPEGRNLVHAGGAAAARADGRPTIQGAGGLQFECKDPFKLWTMTYRGPAVDTTVAKQINGNPSGPRREVEIDMEARMVVPPWIQGEMSGHARDRLESGIEGQFMGGDRYEQLFRAKGSVRIAGEPEMAFTGTGLRIHRVGVRETGEFWGHCWQTAVFPSGKAFGYIAFPPRPDGSPSYSEGFVFDGARMLPAEVVEAPWMKEFVPHGGPVDVVFNTEMGPVAVKGWTHDSLFLPPGTPLFGDWLLDGKPTNVGIPFHKGGARYEWDGEQTYGMIERSLPGAAF